MLTLKLGHSLSNIRGGDSYKNVYSLDFDGVDDFVTMGDSNTFSFGDGTDDSPFSYSFWINAVDVTNSGLINKDASSNEEYHALISSGNRFRYRLYDNSTNGYIQAQINATANTWEGSWQHLVCTYDGSASASGITIYLNGSAPTQTTSSNGEYTAMENTTAALNMGRNERGSQYFDGKIDEVSLWNKELSEGEVTAIYNSGKPTDIGKESGLLGWWRNGDKAGTSVYPTITDDSTNSNNGTMTNMASGDIVASVP